VTAKDPNSRDFPLEDMETSKLSRSEIHFDETDTFNTASSSEPPPPGSLAAWLASNQQAASTPPAMPSVPLPEDEDQWWICCEPLPPIPLGSKAATITIGRSKHADVVLPHSQVSRVHGKIKVVGPGEYRFEDNGSSNGSHLNGERVDTAELKVGDLIAIGPYEIEIHSAESLRNRTRTEADEDPEGEMTSVFSATPKAAMTGRLTEVPITEILQGLEFNRKTGTLEIQCKAGRGRLVVAEGYPIQATFAELYHDEALVEMASLREGSFQFSATVEPAEPRFKATITAALLEAARRVDEGR